MAAAAPASAPPEPSLRHKALAAAGAACVSAVVVNPLDVVKARARRSRRSPHALVVCRCVCVVRALAATLC
jgi:hypothetical protein